MRMRHLFRMAFLGGGSSIALLAAAFGLDRGGLSVLLGLAGIVAGFFGVAGIFLAGFFALCSLLERLGILPPSQPGGDRYWHGYNDGWDDGRY